MNTLLAASVHTPPCRVGSPCRSSPLRVRVTGSDITVSPPGLHHRGVSGISVYFLL